MSRNRLFPSELPRGCVAPREGRVSRNAISDLLYHPVKVAPREGRVSRNDGFSGFVDEYKVAPREGRVSRNSNQSHGAAERNGRAPRGACE